MLVTRPAHQADGLVAALEARGAVALRLPTLAIRPASDAVAAAALIARLDEFDVAVFISPNAVHFGVELIRATREVPAGLALAAVGKATAQTLRALGLTVQICPVDGADSEALLAEPALQAVAGKRVVIFRGEGGREALAAGLRERGAEVEYAQVYRRGMPDEGGAQLTAWLDANAVDVITVTSNAGLENLLALTAPASRERLRGLPLVVVSERMLQRAATLGFTGPVKLARGAGDEALAEAVADWVAERSGAPGTCT